MIYEFDPLTCPHCGEKMRIISFIERRQTEVIERILKHCHLWKDKIPRSPPKKELPEIEYQEPQYDYTFFENIHA